MRKMLVVMLAAAFVGCGADDTPPREPDPKDQVMARRPKNISPEFIQNLVMEIERDYPPTGHDTWAIVNSLLSHPDTVSEPVLAERLKTEVIKALRIKAENIFAIVFIGRDPPGTDDLKFILVNRTGRDVSSVKGVIRVCSSFGAIVQSLKVEINKPLAAGGQAECGGHWPMPSNLIEMLAAKDSSYKLQFVAAQAAYADGTIEKYP